MWAGDLSLGLLLPALFKTIVLCACIVLFAVVVNLATRHHNSQPQKRFSHDLHGHHHHRHKKQHNHEVESRAGGGGSRLYTKCDTTKLNDCTATTTTATATAGVCVRLTSRRVMRDGTVLRANDAADENQGYCLPVYTLAASDGPTGCNAITGSSLITMPRPGLLHQACRCHWPTLFGQQDLYSDCNLHHACDGGKGTLVHKVTRVPLLRAEPPVDIHDYECSACDECHTPGPDPHTGLPSCLPRPFNDRGGDMCVYEIDSAHAEAVEGVETTDSGDGTADFSTTAPMLALKSRFVDTDYLSMFTDRARETARIPNPCSFDLFTGAPTKGGCELRMTRTSRTAYCAPTRDDMMTAVRDDSYLANNNGRYPNACFRLTSNREHVNGYVIEYFLRKRTGLQLPSPVVSARIQKKYVLSSVLTGLGIGHEDADTKMLLFTQPEPPADVSRFPHPFDESTMAAFTREFNTWVEDLPAKCAAHTYNCSAPVQPLPVPACSQIGESDRDPLNKSLLPSGGWIGDQSAVYAKSTVSCTRPAYDARFPVVPNYKVSPVSTDAQPTSAILFFDKSNHTVYPHWEEVGKNLSVGQTATVERYIRECLMSLPHET